MLKLPQISESAFKIITFIAILAFSLLPLFVDLPYRVNIFVTWEGAYRMLSGQIPYKDFGMPIGYGFWLVPYLFFVLFGPVMSSLIKAQAFINIISLLTFRGILKQLKVKESVIFLAILVMCLSFVMINFWPWYNHTVFVYEIIALYFLIYYMVNKKRAYFLILTALFTLLAILTKQDGGGLTLVLISALLVINFLYERQWKPLLFYYISLLLWTLALVVPFFNYDFAYWFNYGQSPHYSRVSLYNLVTDLFQGSQWIKGYIFFIVVILISRYRRFSDLVEDRNTMVFGLLTIGILVQASIIQVTSFSPPTVNLYFHSFALAFILYLFQQKINFNYSLTFVPIFIVIFLWKSDNYWKYSQKVFAKLVPAVFAPPPTDVVSKGNWQAKDSISRRPVIWKLSDFASLEGIKLPENTIEGVRKIKRLNLVEAGSEMKVLNMTNLTSLAYDLNYKLDKGQDYPLWYHKNVSLFDREVEMLCSKIENKWYDLILFEDMPDVDNFFPYEVRDCASSNYLLIDKFLAPTGYISDSVEVYVRR